MKTLAFLLFVTGALMGLVTGGLIVDRNTPASSPPAVPACVSEDDPNDCYWDANRRGNKTGSSFIHWRGMYYLLDT